MSWQSEREREMVRYDMIERIRRRRIQEEHMEYKVEPKIIKE